MQAVREGRLVREANKSGSLIAVAGHFYVGAFYSFYDAWLSGGKTMSESGYVMKDIEDLCKQRAPAMVQRSREVLEG